MYTSDDDDDDDDDESTEKRCLLETYRRILTLINIAKGAMISGCDSTRSDSTSKDASASAAYPLPM